MYPQNDLDRRFDYHAPDAVKRQQHEQLREAAKKFAQLMNDILPDNAEKSKAFEYLETALMWGNASIARGLQIKEENDND